jgi:DNA anti-recombination protein RmuC
MAAEVVVAQQAQLLGEKVGPELTEFAKQALVQGLYTQRNTLMETQRRAQATLQELEDRLSELHLPLQERIQAYERRITELEKELQNRSGEVRELTRATLLLVRQKLDKERESAGTRFS